MWRNYIGESGRRIVVRVKDHNGKNYKSYTLKHSLETGHESVTNSDFSIIPKNLNGNKRKRKIAELWNNHVQHLISKRNQ